MQAQTMPKGLRVLSFVAQFAPIPSHIEEENF